MKTKNYFLYLIAILLSAACLCGLTGCAKDKDTNFSTTEDFKHARFGTFSGSPSEVVTKREFPEAETTYYTSLSDLILALKTNKIDGFILDEIFYRAISWEDDSLSYIDQPLETLDYAFAFSNTETGQKLKAQMDAFLVSLSDSGELEAMQKIWFSATEPEKTVDFSGLTGENGTISLVLGTDNKPFIYLKDGQYVGYEMELLAKFAKAHGYSITFNEGNFNSALMGVEAGKYDIAAYAFNPTSEREQEVLFSAPTISSNMVIIMRKAANTSTIQTLDDLSDATIAILTGSVYGNVIHTKFPNATIKNFSSPADVLLSLKQGKVDAYIEDDTLFTALHWEEKNLTAFFEDLIKVELAFAFNKNLDAEIKNQINEFILQSKADGTLDRLSEKWFGDSEPTEHPQYEDLPATNGTIKVAAGTALKPMSYRKGALCSGYEIDLLTLFAKNYGYALQLEEGSFDAVLTGVSAGKYDLAAAGITITEERKETLDFSEAHYVGVSSIITIKNETSEKATFFENFKEGFEKTFIREDRWKLLLEGLGVTLLISLFSVLLGSLFGFMLYMTTRSQNKFLASASAVAGKIYARIISGTPVVVVLMILFYVVFGSFKDLNGIVVAILGFGMVFGAFVYSHMGVSVKSVDAGQFEAAYALAYSRNKAFFHIILPQAMQIFMPSYCGEIVATIKATAVVGYIAVNDLTRMGDIIRSNTYEAFFPLIATAVIYFVVTWIIEVVLNILKNKFEPEHKNKDLILKGVAK